MALTSTGAFPQGQRTAVALLVAANTTYTGASIANAALLFTAGANGSLVTSVTAVPMVTVTATQLQLFIQPGGAGNLYLLDSVLMGAQTLSATASALKASFPYSDSWPLRLGPNDKLYAGIGVALASGIAFVAQGTDF